MVFVSLIFILLMQNSKAVSILPELASKQDISNIRYITKDGKFTYYQRRSGGILISTSYRVTEIFKGKLGANYEIVGGLSGEKLLITYDENYHTFYSLRKNKVIFSTDVGSEQVTKIGEGTSPALHLGETWYSFYEPYRNRIHLQSFFKGKKPLKLPITNRSNPFFTPQIVMPNENLVIYTDLTEKGFPYVKAINLSTKDLSIIQTQSSETRKIEICLGKDVLYIADFGLDPLDKGSFIRKMTMSPVNLENDELVYESSYNDTGNIVCSVDKENIYFIKNFRTKKGKDSFDIFRFDLKAKTGIKVSDFNFATSMIVMDGRLLSMYQGNMYVILGENNIPQLSILEKKKGAKP